MDATTTQLYVSLLERTNQQLSLWSNPYGVLVAILSFLVAFLAITAAFILYRQSREYRELYQKALKDYEITLQENLRKIGSDYELKIDQFIDVKTKEIDTFSGDTKKKAQEIIKELEKEKDSIGSRIQFSSVNENQHKALTFASQYNDPFRVGTIDSINRFSVLGRSDYCTKCGTYNGGIGISMKSPSYCSNCGNKL